MNFSYSVSLNLDNKNCTVIGGGKIAFRKAETLLTCGAIVKVISPELNDSFNKLFASTSKISWIKDYYNSQYIEDVFLVIAATNNSLINNEIAKYCNERNILVNVIDDKEESNFIVNSFFSRGDLTISVSTKGKSPGLSAKIKDQLKDIYGIEYEYLVEILGEARILAKQNIRKEALRKEFLTNLLETDLLDLLRAGKKEDARERVNKCLLSYLE